MAVIAMDRNRGLVQGGKGSLEFPPTRGNSKLYNGDGLFDVKRDRRNLCWNGRAQGTMDEVTRVCPLKGQNLNFGRSADDLYSVKGVFAFGGLNR